MTRTNKLIILLVFTVVALVSANVGLNVGRSIQSVSANFFTLPLMYQEPAEVKKPEVATPVTLSIPKLNLQVNIESVGQDKSGRMAVPQNEHNAGWWALGAKPGQVGNAVIAGHLDQRQGGPGIFYSLADLVKGDKVHVTDALGRTYTFTVTGIQTYKDESFPLDYVFGETDGTRLNLITCAGFF